MTTPNNWQKSSFSGGADGNNCVEIAVLHPRIAIRDSKNPTYATLTFPTETFTAFLASLKADAR
ncbi:DUF397 domain-containing protein [Streptomyces sp. F001]|uniref:DUF397 domain-containing protein n=1 Tax=Streptomyces sp. F001 TaxID=1510026 RepID=UPI00101E3F36|nr:DUF397 domain-containing protein [Streptomyces sp. F001]RZB17818.1 DUF397 domain-containing protein [Streptomyces sp. F001]